MRIRNRSLLPLPPISHSLALLNLPSKNPASQQLQRKKEATTTTTRAAARGEGWEGRRVQGLQFKGDHPRHILPKEEGEEDRSTTPDVLVTVLKKRNRCISSCSSLPPNPLQTPDGKQAKLEEYEERLTAIHNHNNSKSWGTESAAGHAFLRSSSASSSSSSSHRHQDGRWFEVGEEASLKKRRAGSEEGVNEEETVIMMKEKKGNMRKKKVGKKNMTEDEDYKEKEEEEEEEEEKDGTDDGDSGKKKGNGSSSNSSTGGGSVMEGSRCSRVNGRGWRCCQQTLVGYALCEHHLGKGRLRSMISVRSRSSSTVVTEPPKSDNITSNDDSGDEGSLSPLSCKQWDEGDEEEEEKLMVMKERNKNKRKRIGIVKARSISSLLGQTHQAASTTAPATAIALGSTVGNYTNTLA